MFHREYPYQGIPAQKASEKRREYRGYEMKDRRKTRMSVFFHHRTKAWAQSPLQSICDHDGREEEYSSSRRKRR